MIMKKGFTLIETMVAISLGSVVVLGGIEVAGNAFDENIESQVSNELSAIMEGMDRRLNNDNFEIADWNQYASSSYKFNNRQQVSTFLSTALIATNASNCGLPAGWVPEKEDAVEEAYKDNYKLVPCKLWEHSIGFNLNAATEIIHDGTFVESFNLDLFFDTKEDFGDSGYLHLKNIYRQSKNNNSSVRTGIHDFLFINRTTNAEVTASECINIEENCALRAVYTGSDFTEEYLYTNGTNNMIDSKLKFQEGINDPYIDTCHRYEMVGGVWDKIPNVACGIGIGKKDPSDSTQGNIDYVELNTHSITTEKVFLDKECTFVDSTSSTVKMPCGIYNDKTDGKVYAVYDEVYATTAMIGVINATTVHSNDAFVQNTLDVNGTTTLKGDVTVDGKATFNAVTEINGALSDVNLLVNTSASLKDVSIDGILDVEGKATFEKDLTVGGNLAVTNQLLAENAKITNRISTPDLGQNCSSFGNGSIVYFDAGTYSDLAVCSNNKWKLVHAHKGQVVAFNGSCPSGFTPFSNADGRVLVGAGSLYDAASGTTQTYSVGSTGGQAKVALTKDQMPSHNHDYKDAWYSEVYGPLGRGNTQGSGDTDNDNNLYERNMTTNSVGGGQAHENRMPYYVVNYCIYNG